MTDFVLGPFLLSGERLIWILVTLVLWGAAALLSRRGRPDLNPWAFRATLAGLLGARLGFVAQNADVYLADPLSLFAIWQGGFALWGGVAGSPGLSTSISPAGRGSTPLRSWPQRTPGASLRKWNLKTETDPLPSAGLSDGACEAHGKRL